MPDFAPTRDRPLRGALIGCGNVALRAHLPLWLADPRFRIEALVEPNPDQAEQARRLAPDTPIHSDPGALWRRNGLDFVDICTPPGSHAGLIEAACRAGLHVFCEKPLVTSPASLPAICRLSEQRGRIVFSVNNWKYAPIWSLALDRVRHGHIGQVRSASIKVLRPPGSGGGAFDWRKDPTVAGGGILLDHGWHNLYLLLMLMGDPPESVCARMEYMNHNGAILEHTVDLSVRFPSGHGRMHLTWNAETRRNTAMVEGDAGTLRLNDDHLILENLNGDRQRWDFSEALSAGSHHLPWMKPVIDAFYQEVCDGPERGANLREARCCSELIDRAYQSCNRGGCELPLSAP
jgi:predicted dehydrogenase